MMIVFDKGQPRKMGNFQEMSVKKSKLVPEKEEKSCRFMSFIYTHD